MDIKNLLQMGVGIFMLHSGLAQAQFAAPGGLPPGFQHALLDVLGTRPAFSGRASIEVSNGSDQTPTVMGCHVAMLSGNLWTDVDSFLSVSNMPAMVASQLKQMHSITILRPDLNRTYLVFPTFKSYVEMTFSQNTAAVTTTTAKIDKTVLGKEAVGDHPCEKSQWSAAEGDGQHYDITVWTAADFGNFPIQIKLGAPAAIVTFQDVTQEPPNPSLFTPPPGYIKYEGIQTLLEKGGAQATNAPQNQ